MQQRENFRAGDKVIKRSETDPCNYGEVLPQNPGVKPGYIAVYFRRCVWIKPENVMHFHEWEAKRKAPQGSLKDYWMS